MQASIFEFSWLNTVPRVAPNAQMTPMTMPTIATSSPYSTAVAPRSDLFPIRRGYVDPPALHMARSGHCHSHQREGARVNAIPSEDVTLGEIARGLVSLEARMGEKFNQVNRRLDNLEFVPRGEYAVQIQQMKEEIKDLQDAKRWTARVLVTSFLFPVLVAAVVALVAVK